MALRRHVPASAARSFVARAAGGAAATAPSEGRSGRGVAASSQQGEPFGRAASRRDSSPCSTPMIHFAGADGASAPRDYEAMS